LIIVLIVLIEMIDLFVYIYTVDCADFDNGAICNDYVYRIN